MIEMKLKDSSINFATFFDKYSYLFYLLFIFISKEVLEYLDDNMILNENGMIILYVIFGLICIAWCIFFICGLIKILIDYKKGK